MPLDSSIILGIKPPAPVTLPDPIEQYSKGIQLKALMGQGQLQDLQLQQAQQSQKDSQAVKDFWGTVKPGEDVGARIGDLMKVNPTAGYALQKSLLENKKAQADIEKDTATAGHTRAQTDVLALQHGTAVLDAVKNLPPDQQQGGYQAALSIMDRLSPGASKNISRAMPTYNPAQAQQLVQAGITHAEQLKAQQDAANAKETNRHNVSTEGLTARGQNMVDARSREGNQIQRDAARTEVKQNDDGTFTLIDKGTGVARGVVDAQGKLVQGPSKGLNESQGKAAGMSLRATRANDILNDLEEHGTTNRGLIKQAAGQVPLVGGALEMGVNSLPGVLGGPSSNQQKVEQARRDFVNAVLRVESGASISPSEFANAEKQYFPSPGDTDAVKSQKRANRQTAIDALNLQGGPKKASASSGQASSGKIAGADPTKLSDAELRRELGLK